MNMRRFISLSIGIIFTSSLISLVACACDTKESAPIVVKQIERAAEPKAKLIEEEPIEIVEPELISLGEFRLTAYCSCEICCGKWSKYNKTKSGTTPKEGRTIAVCEDQIPLGTTVIIDGIEYVAEDTGSAITENRIDIYFNDHQVAKEFGVQYKQVFVRR